MWLFIECLFILTAGMFLQTGNGCEMDGIGQWALPQILDIVDIDRGIIFSRSSTNILGITNIRYTEDLKAGPYMDVSLTDSIFSIRTNDAFEGYEQNETLQSFSITVSFSCNGGSSNTLNILLVHPMDGFGNLHFRHLILMLSVPNTGIRSDITKDALSYEITPDFIVNIRDTNNNAPQFLPSDEYEFTIALPVPPGFQITGCINEIIVRDVDLTTQRIQFGIEENPYFEITYDETSSEPKEFKAILTTTTLIRNLPEAVQLTISATDVDTTGDDPITTTAVIKIQGDSDFQLPEEPIFVHPFYLATYTDTELIISEPISLQQGYHVDVQFILEGEYKDNFRLVTNGNSLTIVVTSPLSPEAMGSQPILLVVRADRQDTSGATTTVVISTLANTVEALQFESAVYEGLIIDNELQLPALVLSQGYEGEFTVSISSKHSSFFDNEVQGNTIILSMTPLNDDIINENAYLAFEVLVSSEFSNASAFVVLEIIKDDKVTPVFEKDMYEGSYEADTGLTLETILISQGYDETVTFDIDGEYKNLFNIQPESGRSITLIASTIPTEVFVERYISLTVRANKPRSVGAATAVLIALPDARQLKFEKNIYNGTWMNNELILEPIVINDSGDDDSVMLNLDGDYAEYFVISKEDNKVAINLKTSLPENVISENNFVALLLTASGFHAIPASTAIIIDLAQPTKIAPLFSEAYYKGVYTLETGLQLEKSILITQGFDDSVTFDLDGDLSAWFSITNEDENITLKLNSEIPEEVLQNNNHLLFSIVASKPDSVDGRAVISIEVPKDVEQPVVIRFSQNSYRGSIENGQLQSPVITLEGDNQLAVLLNITGEYATYFHIKKESTEITIEIANQLPSEVTNENTLLVLDLEVSYPKAVSGYTAVILEIIKDTPPGVPLGFEQDYYVGEYTEKNGLVFDNSMKLIERFDDSITFELEGENSQWFELVISVDSVQLRLIPDKPIPSEVIEDFRQLIFLITAVKPTGNATAKAVIIISLEKEIESGSNENFDKVVYAGYFRDAVLQYETIAVTSYKGSNIEVLGEYATLFEVSITSEGVVIVEKRDSIYLPDDLNYIVLELRVSDSNAVLILDVLYSDNPELTPAEVIFSSSSYEVHIDVSRTGLIGRVAATASNGEPIQYTLNFNNVYLQQRLSIDTDGGLFLSAPADTGVYTFQVVAIATISKTTANAQVNLSVDAITICTDDDLVLPPLIILDRDEEEPHQNLVVLDKTLFEGCEYILSNSWPSDQSWLYVDENGLHTRAIDREDPSIAFMALSQVQVELTLQCDSDNDNGETRSSRVLRSDSLGPYDYGSGKWILTDAIPYNPRRSFVNLIVNDINDNYPIFNGKDYEPIAVGYPVRELEEIILPRALIVLKATDLDIGENSAIQYWSTAGELVVSPATGFVHVRDNAKLTNNAVLRVFATDRNGEGLTSHLDLMIKLVDANHIAVVTVKDAFLNDEDNILDELTAAVGYEVKALASAVVSQGSDLETRSVGSRKTRNDSATGSKLMLYVYGMISKEPIEVNILTSDITNNGAIAINIARTVSLEDHLNSLEICALPGRDTALLVATIVLSVLLFALTAAVAVWLLLIWKKKQAYDEFSDENSLASRNDSISSVPKAESSPKPRIRVEDLLRSERRLQEILDSPIENPENTSTLKKNIEPETKVVMPEQKTALPIVIQSIDKLKDANLSDDDDDEFGERIRSKKRKSVVTFNENVEKIIHLEDTEDEESNPDIEVYKF